MQRRLGGEGAREPHVLERPNFPLVIELVVEMALDVGVHGDERAVPRGLSCWSVCLDGHNEPVGSSFALRNGIEGG